MISFLRNLRSSTEFSRRLGRPNGIYLLRVCPRWQGHACSRPSPPGTRVRTGYLPFIKSLKEAKLMACIQVIVLPPEIPMEFVSPTDIRALLGDMVPAMREVIAADPLSTKFEVEVEYIVSAFIGFILATSNAKKAQSRWDPQSRWERYDHKYHRKGKKPYPTWLLNRLRKYLSDHRAKLVNLPRNPLLPGAARVPSRTKLIVLYQRPCDVSQTGCFTLEDEGELPSRFPSLSAGLESIGKDRKSGEHRGEGGAGQ